MDIYVGKVQQAAAATAMDTPIESEDEEKGMEVYLGGALGWNGGEHG